MDDSIQLANEKISQLMGELSHQTFDTYLILTRKGSDGYFELLFDKVTQQPCAAVFRRSGNHCLLVHESEAGLFVGLRGIAVRAYSGDFFGAFREVMDQEPIEKLALDFSEDDASADGLSLGMFTYVFRYFRMPMEELEERITSAAEMMDTVCAQKSPSERRRLEESIRLAEDCISVCEDQIRQGMTELEISDLFVREMKKRGLVSSEGGGPDVPPMLLNLRGGMSHRGPMAVKTLPGDVLILDFFCWYKGFSSDVSRTFYALRKGETEAPAEVMKYFDFVNGNIDLVLEALRPGVRGYEINQLNHDRLIEFGVPDPGIATGHQLGRACHDGGTVLAGKRRGKLSEGVIRENEVYAIEPSCIGDQCIGAHIEDDVVITADGCRLLSHRQPEIYLIPYEEECGNAV